MKNSKQVNKPTLNTVRRMLRNQLTPWELKLWQHLKNRKIDGHKFRRQVSIDNYVVDFCCLELRLVIELDGSGHLYRKQKKKDEKRDFDLSQWGYDIIRFTNTEIDENMEAVLELIVKKCKKLNTNNV